MGSLFSSSAKTEKQKYNEEAAIAVQNGRFAKSFLALEGKLWRDESCEKKLRPVLTYEDPSGVLLLRNPLAKNMIMGVGHSLLRFVEMTAEDFYKRANSDALEPKITYEVLVQWALSFTFKVAMEVFDTNSEASLFCDALAIPSLNRTLAPKDPFFDFIEASQPGPIATRLIYRKRRGHDKITLRLLETYMSLAPAGWHRYNVNMLCTLVTGKLMS